MSRLGRSQPIQPFATHGFLGNTPANGVLPGRILVVEPEDKQRQGRRRPALDPVVGLHGFLGNVPANGVLPPPPTVAENHGQRQVPQRLLPLQPYVAHGPGFAVAVPALPTTPFVVENDDRRRKTPPLQSGIRVYADSTLAAPVPPLPDQTNVDRPEQRRRYLPLDPVVLHGPAPAPVAPVIPPAPYVVPLDERRRFLAALPAEVASGPVPPPTPSATPPRPVVADQQQPRPLPLQSILRIYADTSLAAQTVQPFGPYVVPLSERSRLLAALLPPVAEHGFVNPGPGPVGTTPPPPLNLDRVDQRVRYKPLDPLVLSGVLIPFVPPPPVVVQPGTDWAAIIASFY